MVHQRRVPANGGDKAKLPTLYSVVYLSRQTIPPQAPNNYVREFHVEFSKGQFPYDVGDDPSFFMSGKLRIPVTWGICRADVRNRLQIGDWVVFFVAKKVEEMHDLTNYHFVAALRVERKISQAQVWSQSAKNNIFKDNFNLVIRPYNDGWEHFEPVAGPSKWHADWLWKIVQTQGYQKPQVLEMSREHTPGDKLPLNLSQNYIIFEQESKIQARTPIPVASHRAGHDFERWMMDSAVKEIHKLVFDQSGRHLRIKNRQPHRHFSRPIFSESEWSRAISSAILSYSHPMQSTDHFSYDEYDGLTRVRQRLR